MRGLKSDRINSLGGINRSHPARGAWIEIVNNSIQLPGNTGRTPQGVRGLKYRRAGRARRAARRTPQGVRGLKLLEDRNGRAMAGRTPQGVRGLKLIILAVGLVGFGRTPQGVRGLK